MKKYTRLDSSGLLFLSEQLIDRIDNSKVTVDSIISAESTNDSAAASKAVYDLVAEAISDCVKVEDMHAVTSAEVAEIAGQVWG